MNAIYWRLPLVAVTAIVAGCVSVSRREGAGQVQAMLEKRIVEAPVWESPALVDARVGELLGAPLSPASAQKIALMKNPELAAQYARLGIAQADVVDASRIGNPGFSGSALRDGGPSKITLGLSLPLSDLLLLSSRRHLAEGEYERAQQLIASTLVNLAADINQAWYEAAGAQQVAAMRDAVARAAAASAELAQRYYAAGNLSVMALNVEQATASQARIAATMAGAESTRARLALNLRMGLSGEQAAHWRLDLPMAGPVQMEDSLESLESLAQENRLDLLAARRQVGLLEDALGMVKRWRLLGAIDIGAERERETDRTRLTGPTLSLAIPLFNQGQGAIARAEAELERGRADLARLENEIDNHVRLGVERVNAMRSIVDDYRNALVPQREAIVRQQQERNDFMLIGAFELLLSKQQEFDAYAAYLDAVRDYWLARNDLGRAVGTRLPSEAGAGSRIIGVDSILAAPADAGMGHMHHGAGAGAMQGMDHSGHDMKGMDHSGHDMEGMDHSRHDMEEMDHSGHDMKEKDHSANDMPEVPLPDESGPDDTHDAHGGRK